MSPGIPGEICLRLARDESPIDRSDPLLFCDRQDRVKRAAGRTSHIFGADHGSVVLLQPGDFTLEVFGSGIVVEANDV